MGLEKPLRINSAGMSNLPPPPLQRLVSKAKEGGTFLVKNLMKAKKFYEEYSLLFQKTENH